MNRIKLYTILLLIITITVGMGVGVACAENIDPDNDNSQYAYAENVGWLNFEPGGNGGNGANVTDSTVTGYVWGENIGWINLSPVSYGGVVNDGAGNLSGYAWGENVGWINFKPTYGGVIIDANGNFSGYAWGENIGWIHFQNNSTPYKVKTIWKPTANSAPVANAGADQSVYVNDTVAMDGSGSSDVDGNLLTYSWAFTTKPDGSTATLSDATAVNPTFTVDKAGTYVVSLFVNDGTVNSETDTVTISTLNSAPVASAGADQSAYVNDTVTLDGSSSSDVDGNLLTYSWAFTTKPDGSTTTLSDAAAVNPTFTVDKAGTYIVSLFVNDGTVNSKTDTVTISTINVAPVASAGTDQSITVIGTTVLLDGSQSYDPDGDSITYQWAFTLKPAGSNASLVNPDTAMPTFSADVRGDYVVQLTVKDASTQSSPDTVSVSFENIKPVAHAGTGQSVTVGDTVTIDGSGSTDANGDSLNYRWTLTTAPSGSTASIADTSASITSFVPDVAGMYVAQLVVNDGTVDSDPSTIQVQAVAAPTSAIDAIQNCIASISSLDSSVFKNANMKNTLINKLNAVIAKIEAGNYADALGQLQNDILKKTDGCATEGAPDKNDWIKNCDAQESVYPCLLHSIELVEALM